MNLTKIFALMLALVFGGSMAVASSAVDGTAGTPATGNGDRVAWDADDDDKDDDKGDWPQQGKMNQGLAWDQPEEDDEEDDTWPQHDFAWDQPEEDDDEEADEWPQHHTG